MKNIFKGKYNGRLIVGLKLSIRIRFDWGYWIPIYSKYTQSLTRLFFQISIVAEYK